LDPLGFPTHNARIPVQSPYPTELEDHSVQNDQRELEEAATAAAYQAAAEATARQSSQTMTSSSTYSEPPGAHPEQVTTPVPTLQAPGTDQSDYTNARDAAASEMRRDRVTALDAVEGLNVDANEVLNDRAGERDAADVTQAHGPRRFGFQRRGGCALVGR
jgi:uncharacterized protein (DUF885 family)